MYDIIIVGGGPAGLTAAIYALRAGKTVLVIEKESLGGQISRSPRVENYPGFKAISGAELSEALCEQAEALGAKFAYREVFGIDVTGKTKLVSCGRVVYEARCVIIACGSSPRRLGLEAEERFVGSGVSYCALCDGAFFRELDVCVCGGGNTALQDALYLSDICRRVYLVHRRDEFRGDASLVSRVKERDNIQIITPATPLELIGTDKLEAVRLERGGTEETIEVSGLFVAVGQAPNTKNFADIIELDDGGFATASEDCMTATSGIFVAGDCRKKSVRQLTTAVGDGAQAAFAACEYINSGDAK